MPENNLPLIARLRELHAASTQGEWDDCLHSLVLEDEGRIVQELAQFCGADWSANIKLCVASHNALPAILDALEAAVKERDELAQKWLNKEAECNELLLVKAERDALRGALKEIQEEAQSIDHDGQEFEDERNACTSDDCPRCAIWHGAENAINAIAAQIRQESGE